MKPLCVSFVEQDPQLAEKVLSQLEFAGIEAHHCQHPESLAAQHSQQSFDVVVLDSDTLGEQRLTLAGQLAKHPELRVVMISQAAEPQDRIAAIAAGADVIMVPCGEINF